MTMGKGAIISNSNKQKLNVGSSTERELAATHDPIDCSYIRFESKFGKGICIETLVVFGYMQIFRYKEMDKES